MRSKHARIKKLISSVLIMSGLLSFAILPSLPMGFLSEKVSANGLSPISEMEGNVYAVTASGKLISFNSITPGAVNRNVTITGLPTGETILGIDFRPRTGQLFALSSASRVYTINTTSGAATAVGAAFTPALSGTAYGFDFNPVPDRIRVVSDADQNLRLNPDTGGVAGTDTVLAYATGDPNAAANPNIVGVGYTNNFSGASTTTLFGVDSNLDVLVRQGSPGGTPNSPNGGQLSTIGALGVNTTDQVGFDIAAPGDIALASLTVQGATTSALYSINLTSGAATLVGAIGGGEIVRDIAIVTRVESIFALTAGNNLINFNSGTPGAAITTRAITGLQPGESLLGIDFRPATGQLFAVSNASRVYTVNTKTGEATPVSGAPLATPLNGASFGFDFNPVPDRIRVVSDAEQNLRLNPNNGAIAGVDTPLAFATGDPNASANPNAVGAAYTNSVAGATTTTLFVIDSNLDILALQGSPGGTPNSPNGGQLTTVGALTVNTTDQVGFDIAPQTGASFASLTAAGATSSMLYTINTTSGAATAIGAIAGGEVIRDIAIGINVETVFAVTAGNNLVSFNSLTPGTILSQVPISGLQAGETIQGIDFRPASGQLFGLGSTSRLYTINTINGAAGAVSAATLNPALSGTAFGVDFNPVPDRLRVVSDADQDLRLNPDNGTVAGVDTALAYAAGDPNANANPNAVGAAYTNNFAGTPSTTLFVIDSNLDIVARQGSPGGAPTSPNTGQLFTIGPLGVNTTDQVGFDITDCSGTGFASLTTAGAAQSQFYTINLLSGAATAVGPIGVNEVIRDIALATTFVPSAQNAGLAVVNAASYLGDVVAPDSIVAMFGNFQTQNGQAVGASSSPLPTTLGGVKVSVNGVDAGLFFVSNGQINFIIPSSVADGAATITVANANGTTRTGSVNIARALPGIFTANSSGVGTAAAVTTFDGVTYQSVLNPDGSERPADPGTKDRPNFLVLFVTGLRNAPAANPTDGNGVAEAVTATIQGVPARVAYAGPVAGLIGIDQLNIAIPPELAGQGQVKVRLVVNGQASNTVTFRIGGSAPQVTTQPAALGQTIAGTLASGDQVLSAGDGSGRTYYFDAYRFTATAGTTIGLDLRSGLFDAAVLLYQRNTDGSLTLIGADDDLGGLGDGKKENDNALLLTVLPATGDYVAYVTSSDDAPNATGGYTLRLIGNAIQRINYGATVSGSIAGGDLQTSAGDAYDAYWFAGAKFDSVQIKMSSATFDAFLLLNQNDGQVIAFDDNSGGGTTGLDAQISMTLPATGNYVIFATPFAPFKTGPYTLSLTRSGGAAANAAELAEERVPGRTWNVKSSVERELQFERFAARRVIER